MQRENPCAHKTRGDNDCRRGGLDQCRDQHAEEECLDRIIRHLFHDKLHGGTGVFLQ